MIWPLEEGPVSQTCEFKQIRDCFYDTDSPLSVTKIAEILFKLTSLNDFPPRGRTS